MLCCECVFCLKRVEHLPFFPAWIKYLHYSALCRANKSAQSSGSRKCGSLAGLMATRQDSTHVYSSPRHLRVWTAISPDSSVGLQVTGQAWAHRKAWCDWHVNWQKGHRGSSSLTPPTPPKEPKWRMSEYGSRVQSYAGKCLLMVWQGTCEMNEWWMFQGISSWCSGFLTGWGPERHR